MTAQMDFKRDEEGNYRFGQIVIMKMDERNGYLKGDECYGEWKMFEGEEWVETYSTLKQAKYDANWKYERGCISKY